jgi:hypothetical protein
VTLITLGETVSWNGSSDRYVIHREQPPPSPSGPTR